MVIDFDETWYFKPEVGQFLASPADETPSPPCDAQPDEMDVAIAVDRIETATTLQIRRLKNKWAGLRSFVVRQEPGRRLRHRCPASSGWRARAATASRPARRAGRLAAGLALDGKLPSDIVELGVTEKALSPLRFTQH